jgi:trehalose-6-phosphatase
VLDKAGCKEEAKDIIDSIKSHFEKGTISALEELTEDRLMSILPESYVVSFRSIQECENLLDLQLGFDLRERFLDMF